MAAIRRHVRACATLWLLCQLGVVVFAGEPSCCLAHQGAHAAQGLPAHPEHAGHADSAHCDEACPMHRSPANSPADPFHSGAALAVPPSSHPAHPVPAQDDCVMRAVCNGPAASIASLFPMPAVLADAPRALADPAFSPLVTARVELPKLRVSPDPPPPRA